MKKYLLFVVGDFSDESKSEYITDIISEVTFSTFCNSKLSNESIIINFGYSEDFNILSKYVKNKISNFVDHYILTEYTDNMSLMFPNDESEHFLSLDECDIKSKSESKNEKVLNDFIDLIMSVGNENEQMEEIEQDDDVLIKKSVKKEYNLDDILDKINEKGVSSLTKEENEYLKNLSK